MCKPVASSWDIICVGDDIVKVFAYCIMPGKIFPFSKTIAPRQNVIDCFITSLEPAYSTLGVIASLEDIPFMILCKQCHFLGGHNVPLRDWVKEAFIEPTKRFFHIGLSFHELPSICSMLPFFLPGCYPPFYNGFLG